MNDERLELIARQIIEKADGRRQAIDYVRGKRELVAGQVPVALECDFCLAKADRLWCFPVRAIGVRLRRGGSVYEAQPWRYCVYCHALRTDPNLLAARVYTIVGVPNGLPFEFAADLETTYQVVLEATEGECWLWEKGQAWRNTKRPTV